MFWIPGYLTIQRQCWLQSWRTKMRHHLLEVQPSELFIGLHFSLSEIDLCRLLPEQLHPPDSLNSGSSPPIAFSSYLFYMTTAHQSSWINNPGDSQPHLICRSAWLPCTSVCQVLCRKEWSFRERRKALASQPVQPLTFLVEAFSVGMFCAKNTEHFHKQNIFLCCLFFKSALSL